MTIMTVKASSSRAEAWERFIAANLELQGLSKPKETGKFQKKFFKVLNGSLSWYLFAKEIRPNRGEIVLERLDGKEIRVNILKTLIVPSVDLFFFSEVYKEQRQKQVDFINEFVDRRKAEYEEEKAAALRVKEVYPDFEPQKLILPFSIEDFWKEYFSSGK